MCLIIVWIGFRSLFQSVFIHCFQSYWGQTFLQLTQCSYYLLYPNANNATLSSFPAGFELIAGDTNQRNFSFPVPDIEKSLWNTAPYNTQTFLRQAALGFN